MTYRLSSNQFTIIRTIHARQIEFERAIQFNQVMFYSLVRRGLIVLDLDSESFRLTNDGDAAYERYASGKTNDMLVKNDTDERHERVEKALMWSAPRRKRAATAENPERAQEVA